MQVYPKSWTAIYIALDNVGMWNLRSEFWARQYLGQQFYMRVYTTSTSIRDEYPIPKNALLCGRASGRRTRPLWAANIKSSLLFSFWFFNLFVSIIYAIIHGIITADMFDLSHRWPQLEVTLILFQKKKRRNNILFSCNFPKFTVFIGY